MCIIRSSRYAKQMSKHDNTFDIQNTPGDEQILNGATFQCYFPLVVAKVVFGRGEYEITLFPLCVTLMDLFSNQ